MISEADFALMRAADDALRGGRLGQISLAEMVQRLVAAQVAVPLAGEPVMDGDRLVRWSPATLTKQLDGSQYLLAFTDKDSCAEFSKRNPAYSLVLMVHTKWLLGVLPPEQGMALNSGTQNTLEWSAAGIAAYKAGRNAS